MTIAAVIVAAGQGMRMGGQVKKQFLPLFGRPILSYTIEAFMQMPEITDIVVVAEADKIPYCQRNILERLGDFEKCRMAAGGKSRQESVLCGLRACRQDTDMVLIHDGVRPFVTSGHVLETIAAARQYGAGVLGVRAKDTVKLVDAAGFVQETPDRAMVWAMQTPQAFQYPLILQAYEQAAEAGFLATDDASVCEWAGHPVKIVEGSYENIKITTPEDMLLGEMILKKRGRG